MNRLIRVRLFFAVALVAIVSALALSATRPVDAGGAGHAATAAPAPEALPMLPTIVVVADLDPARVELLPLVTVRPSANELRAARALDAVQVATSGGGGSDFAAGFLPKARLDMPYYSFGTLIPSASKD